MQDSAELMNLCKDAGSAPGVRPKLLVLMAAYNGAPWLQEQVKSILDQQGVDIALVIADDASRDTTADMVVREWGAEPRVELVRWPAGSGSAGANFRRLFRSADASGYDFVALADQDDIWHPGKLAAAVEALTSSGAAGYSCAVQSFWPDGREKVVPQDGRIRGADFLFEGAGQGCTFVMRTALFLQAQAFCKDHVAESEKLHYHDWLIYLLARTTSQGWYFDQRPWLRYRQHGGNEIGSRGGLQAVRRRLELIRNGWFRDQVAAALKASGQVRQHNPALQRFADLFQRPDSVGRRIKLLYFLSRHGRRRKVDRIVLAVAAAAGWI